MSETATQHPERRAEQRWRSEAMIGGKPYVVEGTLLRYEDFGQQLGNGWHIVAATVNGKPRDDGGYVFYDKNWHEPNRPMTLLDVPAAAPLAAVCKAPTWCGVELDAGDPRAVIYLDASDKHYTKNMPQRGMPPASRKGYRFCSPACRDARLPPLAAQPAETKPCGGGDLNCNKPAGHSGGHAWSTSRIPNRAQPTEQPAPAKPHDFSDPYCATRFGRLCVACGVGRQYDGIAFSPCSPRPQWRADREKALTAQGVGYIAAGILRDPAIAERLERPKLAHSFGVEDPALEDA
jgi:hypothetical protein